MIKPEIQIIHISTIPEQPRCTESKRRLQELKKYGIHIKYISDPVYTGPIDLSTYRWKANLHNVKPTHYGCYVAHIKALQAINPIKYDYTIIMEEDAVISVPLHIFIDVVYQAIEECKISPVYYVNFGASAVLERIPFSPLFDNCWHQTLAHCYMIPNKHKDWYMKKIKENSWDVADLWYNHIFCHDRQIRLVSNLIVSKQLDGLSLIDNEYKTY